MELRELAAFREVARLSSFSKAANRLGYVQSTVTAQVQSLERDLGVRLFDRLPRTVVLTPAGLALLPHAERLLDIAGEARSAATGAGRQAGEPAGTVTVSAPESLLTYRMPTILQRLRAAFPLVTVDLRPTPIGRFRSETRRAVAAGEVDVAVVFDTSLRLAGFEAAVLIPEPISVIAPPEHPLASVRRVTPRDLDGQTLLLPEAPDHGCAYRGQFERQLAEAHVQSDRAVEFASIETVKQCVVSGMGISVLPSVAVEADVAAGRLVRLAWQPTFEVFTQIVWNARRAIGPAQQAFMTTAQDAFGR